MRSPLALPAAAPIAAVLLALAAPLAAQFRTTVLLGPAALGTTCFVEHRMPLSAALHLGGFLWSAPFAGAVPVPGLAVNGLLRVDPAGFVLLGVGATNGATALSMPVATPNQPSLLGSQLECQSFDLGPSGTFQLASNDVTLTVVAGPGAALGMVAIPPGTFVMGSINGFSNEQPVHAVTISRPFWMGRHEVTQAQYQALMGSNPSHFQGVNVPDAPQRPVELVSWTQALAYCQALTIAEQAAGRVPAGYQYRLPTEAEWEYCCRAGTTTEWHTGTSLATSQANFLGVAWNWTYLWGQTMPVGSFPPNAFGLHDMHGNVWEWCMDWNAPYPTVPVTDPPQGPAVDPYNNTPGTSRILRGGGWNDFTTAYYCRSAYRTANAPGITTFNTGFRVVLGPIVAP